MENKDIPTSTPRWAPESATAKEMAKWNKPYRFEMYPRMMFKAQRYKGGRYEVQVPEPAPYMFDRDDAWRRECDFVTRFNESTQRVVNDEAEYRRAREEGWRDSLQEAREHVDGLERDIARAAAERQQAEKHMSEAARAEAKAVDDSTFEHVPVIPEKPKARRGRPPKNAEVVQN